MGQGLISKMLCSASGIKNIWTGRLLEYMTEISLVICNVNKIGVCRQMNEIKICAYINYSPLYVIIKHFSVHLYTVVKQMWSHLKSLQPNQ